MPSVKRAGATDDHETVRVVDTTLRDGQMSLWATRMTTPMMVPVVDSLDRVGFDAIEVTGSSFFKKAVRDLREDPWERIRMLHSRMQTPLRAIKTRHIAAFQVTSPDISRLWMQRLAAAGVRQVRVSDPSNTIAQLQEQVKVAREVGLDAIVNLIFSISPKHTDDYYAERAAELRHVPAMRLCLKDPGGLLTPERVGPLVTALRESARGRPIEIHSHCNTGLGPLCAIEAVRHGIRIVNTAIPPLSDSASLPSVRRFMANMAALGYSMHLDEDLLDDIQHHLQAVARHHGFPVGAPAEYDSFHYRHQVPGGMISNFRHQLEQLGMADKLHEVLEETAAVRADLGYPIMVTPYSQFVGSQAALNVVSGQRYQEVTDEIIAYALGRWGEEEAAGVHPDIKDRILGRPRAAELARRTPPQTSVSELRRELDAGVAVSDDELLLRFLTGPGEVEAMRRAGAGAPGHGRHSAAVALVRALAQATRYGALSLESDEITVRMLRNHKLTEES